jgi:hypothetical protein
MHPTANEFDLEGIQQSVDVDLLPNLAESIRYMEKHPKTFSATMNTKRISKFSCDSDSGDSSFGDERDSDSDDYINIRKHFSEKGQQVFDEIEFPFKNFD